MRTRPRLIGLIAGPIVAVLVYLLVPDQYLDAQGDLAVLGADARIAAGIAAWMATWWLTEAIPVYATALLPLAAFPLAGAASIQTVAASYGHPLIYLFLGGFILALALEKCGLHRRFALRVLQAVGTRPTRIVGAFMAISALVSMWVTNTATTIMLLPVALSIIGLVGDSGRHLDGGADSSEASPFSLCLLLGIAYAASIGGIGTIIGTAPNVFLVSYVQELMGREISFVRWMMFGVPLVIVFVPIAWWLLTRRIYPVVGEEIPGVDRLLREMAGDLGRMSRAEKLTLVIFLLTAAAWVCRPLLNRFTIGGVAPLEGLTDSGIAVIAALLLFVTPVDAARGRFLMDWETAIKLPWGLLILFGGGLSLASTLDATGFSAFLGNRATGLAALPIVLMVALVSAMMIFLTEMTSNTATTATLVPILYAVAIGIGVDPYLLIVPACIAASCAFMLPVATPPNAIVFGSGLVSVPQMSRAGFWLNIIAIALIPLLTFAVAMPVLGL
ncbi:MAG: DASS family sodium-coupled anion symporter [Gammaproteobacteria bacterium]|nr:DASS family sodium-coupled anion symporter [Gammaproteobacteria bacterium]